jgi:hypothetical protein
MPPCLSLKKISHQDVENPRGFDSKKTLHLHHLPHHFLAIHNYFKEIDALGKLFN